MVECAIADLESRFLRIGHDRIERFDIGGVGNDECQDGKRKDDGSQ